MTAEVMSGLRQRIDGTAASPNTETARKEAQPPARVRPGPGMLAESRSSPVSAGLTSATLVAASNSQAAAKGYTANSFPVSTLYFGDGALSSSGVPATQPSTRSVSKDAISDEVNELVSKVQNIIQNHVIFPSADALGTISASYITASSNQVGEAFLADPSIQTLFANITKEILTKAPNKIESANPAERAVVRLNLILGSSYICPAIRNALLSQVFNSAEFIDTLRQVKLAPNGQMTLDELVKNDNVMGLQSYETRFALLFQATFYPTELVVQRLESLAGRDDFRSWDLADQQRGAKLCAFAAQYKGGEKDTLDHSWNYILSRHTKWLWAYTKLWRGQYNGNGLDNGNGLVTFNRDEISAGNSLILEYPSLEGDDEADLALVTAAHETSHALHNDAYTLRNDYRAEYVGQKARHGLGPQKFNKRQGYAYISWLISKDNPIREISDAFYKKDPDTIAFIAEVIGLNPKKATFADIVKFDQAFRNNPEILSDKEPAFVPIDNNLDNHFEP